ncbi:MAG: hypothetical protein PHW29_14170 [Flavobacterium sp.]|nr:hypothetical protein [Flavobacterium sp.]
MDWKKLLILFFIFFNNAYALDKKYDLVLTKSNVTQFSFVAYKEILGYNVVLSDAALKNDKLVTINVKNVDEKSFRLLSDNALAQAGFSIIEKDKVFFIDVGQSPSSLPEKESLISSYENTINSHSNLNLNSKSLNSEIRPSTSLISNSSGLLSESKQLKNDGPSRLYNCFGRSCKLLSLAITKMFDVSVDILDDYTLIYRSEDEQNEQILSFLKSADYKFPEAIVQAAIIEVGKTNSDQNGLKLLTSILSGSLGISINETVSSVGNSLKFSFNNFDALLTAIRSNTSFNIMSSPLLRSKQGVKARFEVGSNVPTLGAITTTSTGSSQSIVYMPTGTILEFTPVFRGEFIELELNAEVSSAVPTTTGVNTSPTILKRTVNTTISLLENQVVAIGGFTDSSVSKGSSGLSFLPFNLSSSNSESSRELLLVLSVKRI